ncbi:DUF1016 family protein [Cryobacterium tagatosivorans]|uniref:DUF1016 family protein n=1 Tax=Cryobacterium tagatosivorans TaxID=1259199 RepID=A0A4R8UHM9_9MICO|nr:DUF1016 family protein [Cryobacterium tagatosivorans]
MGSPEGSNWRPDESAEGTAADSDLARQIGKDPYVFDFLELTEDAAERDLERAPMDRIVDTLRELGTGFAFVRRQVHFDAAGDDFYLDLRTSITRSAALDAPT